MKEGDNTFDHSSRNEFDELFSPGFAPPEPMEVSDGAIEKEEYDSGDKIADPDEEAIDRLATHISDVLLKTLNPGLQKKVLNQIHHVIRDHWERKIVEAAERLKKTKKLHEKFVNT